MPKLAPAENQEPMSLWGRDAADTGKVGGGGINGKGRGYRRVNQVWTHEILITKQFPHVFKKFVFFESQCEGKTHPVPETNFQRLQTIQSDQISE